MSGELHNLSAAIGRLQEGHDAGQRQRADLYNKVEGLRDDVGRLRSDVQATNGKLDTVIEKLGGVVGLVGQHEQIVQQGKGASRVVKLFYACLPAGGVVGVFEVMRHLRLFR